MLDSVARAEYRERLRELSAEVAEAEEWNDPERVNRAQQEMEFLAAELGRAVGLGGRDRRASAATERARLSVTRATRAADPTRPVPLPSLCRRPGTLPRSRQGHRRPRPVERA